MMRIGSRLKHWWAMSGLVGKVLALSYAAIGLFLNGREFLPPDTRAKLDALALVKLLPDWSIGTWSTIGLLILLVGVLEKSWARYGRSAPSAEITVAPRGALNYMLRLKNDGPPAEFGAVLNVVDTSATHHKGYQGPLFWETGRATTVRLLTGGSDWILLGSQDRVTLYRWNATMSATEAFLDEAETPKGSAPFVLFEVTIVSDPPLEDGPLTRRFEYDRDGIKEVPLAWTHAPTLSVAEQGLSLEEKDQIQKVRYAWKEFGTYAANGLDSLLDQVLDDYARKNPIGGFLYHAQHQLRRTRKMVEAAVANDSVQSLEHVQAHLNNYTEAYIYAYALVQVIHENGMPVAGDAYKKIVEVWHGLHETWREKLVELYHRPEHGDRLRTFRDVRPPGFLPPTLAVGALRVNATGTVIPPPSIEEPESNS